MNSPLIVTGLAGEHLDRNLTPLIREMMQSCELPGLAIGVVADREIVYARGFGVRRSGDPQPISMDTVFHMASISKPFVATAIMQLVERGKVQLATPVVDVLPYFKLDDARYREITIQHMLSHVSGMPDEEDYEWMSPQYDAGALERYVRRLSARKLMTAPGETFAYSNIAFECLGDVIARLSGLSFDDYVKAHILDPAGMAESTFLKPEYLPENWAAAHVRVLTGFAWDGYPYNRMHGPSSTLHSNAVEMCNWAIANLNRGSFDGQRILDSASYDLLWKPWVVFQEPEEPGSFHQFHHVGLSWFLGEYRGEALIEHSGGDTGFETHFAMLPGRGAAVVILCNQSPAPVEQIAYATVDLLLGCTPAPILPGASLPVCKTLQAAGLDAAVAHWHALQQHHPGEYDFSLSQFSCLYNAVSLKRVREAGLIASLCAQVLPEPDLRQIEAWFTHNSSEAGLAVLNAIWNPFAPLSLPRASQMNTDLRYIFVPMNQEYAAVIVGTWKYAGEYAIYDYANEADHMLDPEAWGRGLFAVLDPNGDLIGELSIEFFDEQDNPAEYRDFGDEALINTRQLWIGFGLRPDLTGQGRGAEFVASCAEYALRHTPYHGDYIYLGVAQFNQRAIKAYEKAGFATFAHTDGEINGKSFKCVHMRKKC